MALNHREVAIVKGMLDRGDKQHDIAAYFGVNGGRVAEIKTESYCADIAAADVADLPAAGPVLAGRSALHARDTLLTIRSKIDEVLADIEAFERG